MKDVCIFYTGNREVGKATGQLYRFGRECTEARFDHGEFGEDVWRVHVKRYQNRAVDWPEIETDFRHAGDANFCFVSVFGFTDEARRRADEEGVWLLEAGDFIRFLLGGKLRPRLREKLRLPFWGE